MHSKNFVRGFLVLSAAALVAIPTGVFADPGPTPTPSDTPAAAGPRQAERQRSNDFRNDLERAQRKATEIRNNRNSTDEQIEQADAVVDDLQTKFNQSAHNVTSAERLEDKVGDKEDKIAKAIARIAVINDPATTQGMPAEDVQKLIEERDGLVRYIAHLNKAIAKKAKRYKNKTGDDLRCGDGQEMNTVTNHCRTACTDKQVVYPVTGECEVKCKPDTETRDEKTRLCDKNVVIPEISELRKNAACYGKKFEKKIYSLFKKGESDVVLRNNTDYADEPRVKANPVNGGTADPDLTGYFEHQVSKLTRALIPNNRITSIETTSYQSKIGYLPKKDAKGKLIKGAGDAQMLTNAHERSKESVINLYAQLGIGSDDEKEAGRKVPPLSEGWVRPAGLDYGEHITEQPIDKVSVGPTWTAGEYERLDKLPVPTGPAGEKMLEDKAIELIKIGVSPVIAKMRYYSKDPKGDQVKATANNLRLCCSASQAKLKFEPYQFTEMKVTIQEYDRNLPGCLPGSGKVADKTTKPDVGGLITGCVPDEDNDCVNRSTSSVGEKKSGDANK
jgi:hypothetical protein